MYTSEQQPYAPNYVMLGEDKNDPNSLKPPPYRRNIPRYHSNTHKKKVATLAIIFFICAPKVPSYKVHNFQVDAFEMRPDFSLYTQFIVTVKADNPNTQIGINYLPDSSILVEYRNSILSSGQLPIFYQGHQNITLIKVKLDGKSTYGSGLQEALVQNRNSGKIPLKIKVEAPVTIKVGQVPLKTVIVFADIKIVVDNLSPKKKIGILSSEYKIRVESKVPHFVYQVV
ncbi:hypothetical protein AQUCO_05400051v1 [Aquilegia coerulea]|uniref:Late embryogenesis abundant protein LEA-2 subgroup domain-containing protein n=1 Tax=Aquilegia coerulea TaxID=218851 RepID=A0A2G5CHD2_AQUCA|nr:hypothetical protein AQUCO_05400051v1 [Aquilegia coerulea]